MRYPRVDLHVHTTYSDGRSPIEDVVRAAEANELEGLAITDHVYDPSQRVEWLEKAAEELSRAEPRIGVVLGVEVTKVGLSGLSIGE
ncbi:MAG: PHP domain-containing protein, partial [Thermoproteales archaeon]|nr:PHP domain-containing protein [Thermoproteales archaeon]